MRHPAWWVTVLLAAGDVASARRTGGRASAPSQAEVVANWAASTVLLGALEGPGRFVGLAAGLLVNRSGLVVTASEALDGVDAIFARSPDGTLTRATHIVASDPTQNLMLLRMKAGDIQAASLPKRPPKLLREMMRGVERSEPPQVLIVGGPLLAEHALGVGRLISLVSDESGDWLELSAPGGPGLLGGVVVDGTGKALGLLTGLEYVDEPLWRASLVTTVRRFVTTHARDPGWRLRRAPAEVVGYGTAEVLRMRPVLPASAEHVAKIAEGHFGRAAEAFRKGDRDAAQTELWEALRWDPHLAKAHSLHGTLLNEQSSWEQAQRAYEAAWVLDPTHTDSCASYALMLHKREAHERAESVARSCLRQQPDHAEAQAVVGSAMAARGICNPGAGYLYRALQRAPTLGWVRGVFAACLGTEGSVSEAILMYREGIRADPRNVGLLVGLAEVLAERGELDDALRSYSRAVALEPDKAGLQARMGDLLVATGNVSAAAAAYRRALDLDGRLAHAAEQLRVLEGMAEVGSD